MRGPSRRKGWWPGHAGRLGLCWTALVTSPPSIGGEGGISRLFSSFKSEECRNSERPTSREGPPAVPPAVPPTCPSHSPARCPCVSTTQTEPLCPRGSVGAPGDGGGDVGSRSEAGRRAGSRAAVTFQWGARPGWWESTRAPGTVRAAGPLAGRALMVLSRTRSDTHAHGHMCPRTRARTPPHAHTSTHSHTRTRALGSSALQQAHVDVKPHHTLFIETTKRAEIKGINVNRKPQPLLSALSRRTSSFSCGVSPSALRREAVSSSHSYFASERCPEPLILFFY